MNMNTSDSDAVGALKVMQLEDAAGTFVGCTAVIAKRILLRYLRTPQFILITTVQAVAFLFIFRFVFGGAIQTGELRYVDYMSPGLFVATLLFSAMSASVGAAQDMQSGFLDRLLALPIPRIAVTAGRVAADVCMALWGLAIIVILSITVGFRINTDWYSVALAFLLCVLFALTAVFVFATLGSLAGDIQTAEGIGFVALPLTFISSAYVPIDTMPIWLQPIAEHQPVTIAIDAVRSVIYGAQLDPLLAHSTGYYVAVLLLWCTAAIGACIAVVVRRFG